MIGGSYFLYVLPAMLFALYAQMKVRSAFAQGKTIRASSGLSGAQAAHKILAQQGLSRVRVEQTQLDMGDHYDPKDKVLRLSPDVFNGHSITALGVAAHEAGHAIQDQEQYTPLVIRNGIVPLAAVGNASMYIIMVGAILNLGGFVLLGIGLFSIAVLFQIINLPVEFDASARARKVLLSSGMISQAEDRQVGKVLNAAAMTYVAATITAVITLLHYLSMFNQRD
jgi:Zn-dependent membrane protease YugP